MGDKTKKPSGCKVARNKLKMTFSWKIESADHGAGQEFKYYNPATKKWVKVTIGKTTTSKTIAFDASDYAPNTSKKLSKTEFQIRGRRKQYTTGSGKKKKTHTPDWSDWTGAEKSFSAPSAPSVSLTPTASDGQITLAWSVSTKDDDAKPFHSVEWQTRLVQGKSDTDWSKVSFSSGKEGWGTGTGNASGSYNINNDTSKISTGTWTRVVRVRSRGAAGNSDWKYAYYVYATPKTSSITAATATKKSRGCDCSVTWKPDRSFAYPVDNYIVQYLVAVPGTSTLSPPVGGSWNDAADPVLDSSGKASLTFHVDDQPQADNALWFRVNTVHGIRTTYGTPKLVLFGGLKSLESGNDLTAEYDSRTKVLTLSAENPSEVPGTNVYVDIKPASAILKTVKIPAAGSTAVTIDLNSYASVSLNAYVNSDSCEASAAKTKTLRPRRDATYPYAFCPTTLNLSKGSTAGTVNVSWNSVLEGVTGAEVSYSTDENAWSTAGEPYETVTASGLTSTIVSDIEYGEKYYFAVRQTNQHGTTQWSARKSITLSTSDIPVPDLAVTLGNKKDELKVTWKWSTWAQAEGIELSWADASNAWDSSGEPTSKTISKKDSNGIYYISDLERDKTWYVRARFVKGTTESNPVTKQYKLEIIPVAPTGVTFVKTDVLSTPRLSWNWSWDDAEAAEVSWADSRRAWDATEGTKTQDVDRSRKYIDIPNLETGRIWYARVKFIFGDHTSESDIVSVDLRTNPVAPSVTLSEKAISAIQGKTDISWNYYSEDGMAQMSASVCLAEIDNQGNITLGRQIASAADTSTAVPVYAEDAGLVGDNDYWIVVRVVSVTGFASEWSSPVKLSVSSRPTAVITSSSLQTVTLTDEYGEEYEVTALTEMPVTMSATGIGNNGTITGYIERAEPYFLARPEGKTNGGHEGEIVVIAMREGDGDFVFAIDDLMTALDDGAKYRLCITVKDSLGQTDDAYIDFTVLWNHQAIMPEATAVTDTGSMIVKITPIAPQGTEQGDTADIYRLSTDMPELIVKGAAFGETYVDPYPAFGEMGGHRVVFRTMYGDYITEDGHVAWIDLGEDESDRLDLNRTVIDFGEGRAVLKLNLDVSHSWEKDFTETKYLGGSVQGDWNPAVTRKTSVTSVALPDTDVDLIRTMRELAAWPGICHVRTPDGSSFAADIEVSEERPYSNLGIYVTFRLSVTRVDPEGFEGMTLSEWENENGLE